LGTGVSGVSGVSGVGLDRGRVGLELLGLDLLGPAHGLLDLGPHVGDADHHQAGLAGVEMLAQLLEVVAAHAGGGVARHRPQRGPAGGGGGQQPGPDPGEREQGDDQACGQPDPAAEDATDPGRGLVLLGDLDLAVVPPLDHGGVVGVDQPGLGVQVLDQLVVRFGLGHAGVHPDIGHERVDGHPPTSLERSRSAPSLPEPGRAVLTLIG
jgi:hypothetical protein